MQTNKTQQSGGYLANAAYQGDSKSEPELKRLLDLQTEKLEQITNYIIPELFCILHRIEAPEPEPDAKEGLLKQGFHDGYLRYIDVNNDTIECIKNNLSYLLSELNDRI